jgi:hypothetical protein
MPYRLRYQVWCDFMPAGVGPMAAQLAPMQGDAGGSSGAQTLELFNVAGGQIVVGGGTNNALVTGDVTTLTNAMAADISAQMNVAATLARLAGFATGSP